jgi:hypothetical protein
MKKCRCHNIQNLNNTSGNYYADQGDMAERQSHPGGLDKKLSMHLRRKCYVFVTAGHGTFIVPVGVPHAQKRK